MKHSVFLLASWALSALGSLTLHQRDNPSVVGFDIKRKDVPNPIARDHVRRKRDKTVTQGLDNQVRYEMQLFRPDNHYTYGVARKRSIIAISL